VLTIEPGLYATGVGGIRLEDDVAVTDGEPELLSSLPLELREVPA
jgi:Xaa-Pro aminopeptidase